MPSIARDAVVHVAGHRGLVGSAIWRHLAEAGFTRLVGRSSAELDLRDRPLVDAFYDEFRPDFVILAAARVGGILANSTRPTEFLSDNLRIQLNVLDASARIGVAKVLFLGSDCIYPKFATQPIREDSLLTGPLEATNDAYAIAKIAGIIHVQAIRRQFGLPYISAMPTNLYGPGDNFDPQSSHVMPALIRRFHEAKVTGDSSVAVWVSGRPRREFLYVDDLAAASLTLLESYDDASPINVGVGNDVTIAQLAEIIASVVGWEGEICWDASKPDGTPRKLLDIGRLGALGWKAEVELTEGIRRTYAWYLENIA